MRKTSYAVTFLAVLVTLTLNIVSWKSPEWLVLKNPEVLRTRSTVYYGLERACTEQVIQVPAPNDDGHLDYYNYTCRNFPGRVADRCEKENESFCAGWITAGYATELSIGFASVSLLAILIGVSTHSRRRRIWRAVAGLVLLHTVFQLVAFSIVTDAYRVSSYPAFEQARLSTGYVLNTVSWILGVLVFAGVVTTGISADKGHRWAAGNRAYRSID